MTLSAAQIIERRNALRNKQPVRKHLIGIRQARICVTVSEILAGPKKNKAALN
jgi:hypothetical protein